MKSIVFLLVGLSIITQSCNNDIENDLVESNLASTRNIVMDVNIEVVNNGNTLKFKNQQVFEQVVGYLQTTSDSERLAFADSLGFKSLLKIRCEADKELDIIVEESSSKEQFTSMYNKYKNKYSSVFVFNNSESEELFPYLLLEDPYTEYYTGLGGNVIIGDKEVVNKKIATVELYKRNRNEIDITPFVNETPVNDAGSQVGKRKVGLHMHSAWLKKYGDTAPKHYVEANFTAQKKNMFGWVRYSTVYFSVMSLGDFTHQYMLPNGLIGEFRYNNGDSFAANSIGEQSGNYTMIIGYGEGVGSATFWSRGIAQENAGNMIVSLPRK